jgi:hypothetical protein
MRREGVDLRAQPTFPEQLPHILRSLAVFFRMLAEALAMWAKCAELLIMREDAEGRDEK